MTVMFCVMMNQPYHRTQLKNANLPRESVAKLVYRDDSNERHSDLIVRKSGICKQIAREQMIKKQQEQQAQIALQQQIQAQQEQLRAQAENSKVAIEVSYYTANNQDCGKSDGISSSGKYLDQSYVYCAAPSDIPFGTKITLDSGDTLVVVDRGGAIKYTYINGAKVMKVDVFVKDATEQELDNKGVVQTKGNIVK